ncbi:MAG: UbiD family decarboxylase, partial [Desulfobacterales bacterium]|nr:UbiD family decarboxylase [Desulfobacterales bacterium]
MYYKDLRDWIKQVDEFGELARIDGADWDLEIGALTEISRNLKGREAVPALLFDSIPGYPAGYRVITSLLFSTRRVALTAGIAPEADTLKFTRALFEKVSRSAAIPPEFVATGPVLENVQEGGDVDVLKFPAPKFHEEDGGRYLGTASVTITRDPDDGWVNLGT